MNPIEHVQAQCPWCGSPVELEIDCSAGDQRYVEDCTVCCQPIVVTVGLSSNEDPMPSVVCERDD